MNSIQKNNIDLACLINEVDLLFITLDTLRFDVAQQVWQAGELSTLSPYLGTSGWECRHTPASFTYAAHHGFFSGYLPTPIAPGPHPRLFASRFGGSETTTPETFVFDCPTLPESLSQMGFRTICIGGTGFFNPVNSLGQVLPSLFDESHWSVEMGVTGRASEVYQVELAIERLSAIDGPSFLFINIAAIHQPNWFYDSETGDQQQDTLKSHAAALIAVDRALKPLFEAYQQRTRKTLGIICSDHGTAYGESGYSGHRLAHEVIWNVPYTEFLIE